MLRIIICEDDAQQRAVLSSNIKQLVVENEYPAMLIAVTADFQSFKFATTRDLLQRSPVDRAIYFLDIDLRDPSADGFSLATYIREQDPQAYIVFITAFRQFVRKGYQFQAFDYIYKTLPVEMLEDLADVMKRIMIDYRLSLDTAQESICLHQQGQIQVIKVDDLIGVGRERHCYNIYCTFGVIPYVDTLVALERKMASFPWIIRCHQSAIVNLHHVKRLLSNRHEVVMDNDLRFPVSRRRYRKLIDQWNGR